MTNNNNEAIIAIIKAIKESKKYCDTCEATIRHLAIEELKKFKTVKRTIKSVKRRLYSIVASYLGDPDYDVAKEELKKAFASGDEALIKAACYKIMETHLSTRERNPIVEEFYTEIFRKTGTPTSIIDIACGLNPLSLPWTVLPPSVKYHAFDIHEKRIDFLNYFFSLQGLQPLAKTQDIAINFPQETADLALFLKEMHRFERNYRGRSLALLEALQVRYLAVSFPTVSSTTGRSVAKIYKEFFYKTIKNKKWCVTEIEFDTELVLCVDKLTYRNISAKTE